MQSQTGWTLDRPTCGNTDAFGKAAGGSHAKIKPNSDDVITDHKIVVTGFQYNPCRINARSMRKVTRHTGVTCGRQAVLEIQRGEFHLNQQFAFWQIAFFTTDNTAAETCVAFLYSKRFKTHDLSYYFLTNSNI